MEGERAAINSQVECNYCGDCETVCPTAALACPVEVLLLPGRPAPYPAARTGERTGSGSGKGKGGTPHTGKKVEKTK